MRVVLRMPGRAAPRLPQPWCLLVATQQQMPWLLTMQAPIAGLRLNYRFPFVITQYI